MKTLFILSMLSAFTMIALAGDLNPTNPPGPTMKTLNEVEPRIPIQSLSGDPYYMYVIDQPGSYFITGDIIVSAHNKTGILVDANDVSIDLMGYALKGPDSGTGRGIFIDDRDNVEIRNGTIRDFGYEGIWAGNFGTGNRHIRVRVLSNGRAGIYCGGRAGLITGCTAAGNGEANPDFGGIYAGYGYAISGNTCYDNAAYGLMVNTGCTVTGNTAYSNGNYGIYLSTNCLVDQNTAYDNNQSGGTYPNMNTPSSCTFGTNHAP